MRHPLDRTITISEFIMSKKNLLYKKWTKKRWLLCVKKLNIFFAINRKIYKEDWGNGEGPRGFRPWVGWKNKCMNQTNEYLLQNYYPTDCPTSKINPLSQISKETILCHPQDLAQKRDSRRHEATSNGERKSTEQI